MKEKDTQKKQVILFEIEDSDWCEEPKKVKGEIEIDPYMISIKFDGYGTCGLEKGHGYPINIQVYNNELKTYVYANIDSEEPTQVINLEYAREEFSEIDDIQLFEDLPVTIRDIALYKHGNDSDNSIYRVLQHIRESMARAKSSNNSYSKLKKMYLDGFNGFEKMHLLQLKEFPEFEDMVRPLANEVWRGKKHYEDAYKILKARGKEISNENITYLQDEIAKALADKAADLSASDGGAYADLERIYYKGKKGYSEMTWLEMKEDPNYEEVFNDMMGGEEGE